MTIRTLAVALSLFAVGSASAGDWPQWRGPNRDGHSDDKGLAKKWPTEGPKLEWTFKEAGLGYSGFAVVGNTLYTCGAEDKEKAEFALAIDITTGKQIWRTNFGPWFGNNWGGGPRCTPTVAGDAIYVLGAKGELACLAAADGKLRWKKNLVSDLKGKLMSGWGYSESVLVDGDQVVCSPGGDEGSLAALDAKTGDVRWRSTQCGDPASYSSIVVSDGGGVRHYVQLTGSGVIGVHPKSGDVLWRIAAGDYKVAVIPTAVVKGDHIFATTSYGAKCMLIKLSADGPDKVKAEKVYSNKNLENHHGGVVLVDDCVYGSHGNANSKKTLPFTCLKLLTGEVAWKETGKVEPSGVTYADGELYCFGQQTGKVTRIRASSSGFAANGSFTIPQETERRQPSGAIWTHPVIANGRLYLRDQELIFCYDLRAATAAR